MMEEILPDLYKIDIPLPRSPLRAVNSYLIKAHGRFLIIDTGMNREECKREMLSNLKKLNVDLKKTDFFITHMHTDHVGLVADLASEESVIYFNRPEASALDFRKHWQETSAFFRLNAFPENELKKAFEGHPGYKYNMTKQVDFHILEEGDTVEAGDYRFRCIETPGHSPGHICLYEANKKLLVSGDHILLDITPNISLWFWERNALKEYLASLDKVCTLELNLVLPGHGHVFNDLRTRVLELKQHHKNRTNEILSILGGGAKNAYQISSLMTWDVEYSSWELFPSFQKWFAVGETLSHLKYLEEDGLVQSKMQGNEIVFYLA